MAERTEGSFRREGEDVSQEQEAVGKLLDMTEQKRKTLVSKLSIDEIHNLAELAVTLEMQKMGLEQTKTRKKQASPEDEKSEHLVQIPIQEASRGGSVIGQADCTEEKGVWIFKSLDIKGNVNKSLLIELANRLGINDLEKKLAAKGVWADQLNLTLNCKFVDKSTAPRVFVARHEGTPVPIALEDQLFGNWRHSGKAQAKIDTAARPPKIEFIID